MSEVKLNKNEIEFLKTDHGYNRVIHRQNGEIYAVKNGKTVFVGWNADDVRQMQPAMRDARSALAEK